jgi:asparagine synthase (glutamine-hydrolysing)
LRQELRPLCEELLSEQRLRGEGILNATEVRRLIDEHMTGRRNHRKKLWTLMAFQLWQAGRTTRSL